MSKHKENKKPASSTTPAAGAVTPSGLDLSAIRELAKIAGEFGLTEIEAEPSGRIRISRRAEVTTASSSLSPFAAGGSPASSPSMLSALALAPPPSSSDAQSPGDPALVISSPFVGTFYRAPSPEAPAFAEVGQSVRKGQVVCIVEAMKLMNEIEAEAEGRVAEILVKNGEHVEYGQALIRLTAA